MPFDPRRRESAPRRGPKRAPAPADDRWEKREAVYWSAIDEDIDMTQRIHKTLRSGANTDLLFGRYEHMILKVHEALDKILRGEANARGQS